MILVCVRKDGSKPAKRKIDMRADLSWSDGAVQQLESRSKEALSFPKKLAPSGRILFQEHTPW